MDESMLTAVDRDVVVNLLINGDNLPSNIAENTDRHVTSVSRRLAELDDQGLAENKGSGVWTLTLDGIVVARTVRRSDESSS